MYARDWEEGDFVLFHNRRLLHSVVGEDEVSLFRQCNVAANHFFLFLRELLNLWQVNSILVIPIDKMVVDFAMLREEIEERRSF